jgi:membrane fusion protein, heavy metal efflux system
MKYLFITIFTSLLLNCTSSKKEEITAEATVENIATLSESQLKSTVIKTEKLMSDKISTTITVHGKIEVPPQNLVSVSIGMSGFLKSTKLLPGMHLRKGEVIATLEDQQYIQLQQDYLTSKVKLEQSTQEYQRQRELNVAKASSDKVYQNAYSEYQTWKINTSALAEKLKLIQINPTTLTEERISKSISLYAPFDGYVSKVNVNIGKYIAPSDVLFELIQPTDIHLLLTVYEKDLSQLSIGQNLMAYTNTDNTKKYKSNIILIGKDISKEGTAEVHCHFDAYDHKLIPGMYMNADINVANQSVMTIPEAAVVHFEGKNYVFEELQKGKYKMNEVTVFSNQNGKVALDKIGDLANKNIVTEGAYMLLMSLKNVE